MARRRIANEFVFGIGDALIPLDRDFIDGMDEAVMLDVFGCRPSKVRQKDVRFIGRYPVRDARKKFL